MLMKKFMDKPNCIITRVELLMELWDDTAFVEDNTLTVNITRIKTKLNELGINEVIRTVRGSGYIFVWNMQEGCV
jgi:DNA-binding response OmpR family regulator